MKDVKNMRRVKQLVHAQKVYEKGYSGRGVCAVILDTHPDSTDAMAKFDDLNDKYVKLKEKFEDEYGPLLSKDADSPVQWIKGPWPWEVQ